MTDWRISASDWSTVSERQLKGGGKGRDQGRGWARGVWDGAGSRSREAQARRPRSRCKAGGPPTWGDGGGSGAQGLRGSGAPSIHLFGHRHKIVSLWRMRCIDRGEVRARGGRKGRGKKSPFRSSRAFIWTPPQNCFTVAHEVH